MITMVFETFGNSNDPVTWNPDLMKRVKELVASGIPHATAVRMVRGGENRAEIPGTGLKKYMDWPAPLDHPSGTFSTPARDENATDEDKAVDLGEVEILGTPEDIRFACSCSARTFTAILSSSSALWRLSLPRTYELNR